MNNPDKTSRSGVTTDIAVSSLDVQQRLRLAAHILANGAIRAALKQQANQQPKNSAEEDCNAIAINSQRETST